MDDDSIIHDQAKTALWRTDEVRLIEKNIPPLQINALSKLAPREGNPHSNSKRAGARSIGGHIGPLPCWKGVRQDNAVARGA